MIADLALDGRAGPYDVVRVVVHVDQVAVRGLHALEGFADHVVGFVDELLHPAPSWGFRLRGR